MNCNIELACTKDLKRSQTQSWRTHKAQERPTCIYIHNLYINASINLSIYLFYLSIHPPILPSIHASIYKYLSYLDMHLLFAYPYYLCIYLGTIEHIISSIIYIYISMYIQRKSLWGPTAWQKCVFFFPSGAALVKAARRHRAFWRSQARSCAVDERKTWICLKNRFSPIDVF